VLHLDGLGDPADGGAREALQEGHLPQELRHCTPMASTAQISQSRSQIRQALRWRGFTFFPIHRRRQWWGRQAKWRAAFEGDADKRISSDLKSCGKRLAGRWRGTRAGDGDDEGKRRPTTVRSRRLCESVGDGETHASGFGAQLEWRPAVLCFGFMPGGVGLKTGYSGRLVSGCSMVMLRSISIAGDMLC
jgi:hypothetical protein